MFVNLTVTSFICQGLKTPVSQLKSSKEDSMTFEKKFSPLVHFNGLELLDRGFQPLAEMAPHRWNYFVCKVVYEDK
jgi:hypothetical protein